MHSSLRRRTGRGFKVGVISLQESSTSDKQCGRQAVSDAETESFRLDSETLPSGRPSSATVISIGASLVGLLIYSSVEAAR